MRLTWAICHRDGTEKGWIIDRLPGSSVTVELNGQRSASIRANAEERLSRLVHPGRTRIKTHCIPEAAGTAAEPTDPDSYLLHNGLILEPRAIATDEEETVIELPSVDQSWRLLNASHAALPIVEPGEHAPALPAAEEMEQSAAMWDLIERADARAVALAAEYPDDPPPTLGIVAGDLVDTGKTRLYRPGADVKTTWDELVTRARKNRAPDFELQPVDREDGIHARLNTFWRRQGRDRTERVVLEYGYNLSGFDWEPTIVDPGLINSLALVGQGRGTRAPVWVAENHSSMRRQGVYHRTEYAGDVSSLAELRSRAEERVAKRSFPVNFFDLVLPAQAGGQVRGWLRDALGNIVEEADPRGEYMLPPSFGPPAEGFDFWLGDQVTVRVHDLFRFGLADKFPGVQTDFVVRITAATFTEADEDGTVVVSLTATPALDKAHVTGYASAVDTDTPG